MYVITEVSRNEPASFGSLFLALITTKEYTFCVPLCIKKTINDQKFYYISIPSLENKTLLITCVYKERR